MELPSPSATDLLAIHDTGAYTMAMYCKWVEYFSLNCVWSEQIIQRGTWFKPKRLFTKVQFHPSKPHLWLLERGRWEAKAGLLQEERNCGRMPWLLGAGRAWAYVASSLLFDFRGSSSLRFCSVFHDSKLLVQYNSMPSSTGKETVEELFVHKNRLLLTKSVKFATKKRETGNCWA